MTDAGYSGTPLARKIGLKPGQATLLLGVPDNVAAIGAYVDFAVCEQTLPEAEARRFDYIHVFVTERTVLEAIAAKLMANLKPDGMLWISWPKKVAKVPTTVTEDVLREILLPIGLVDVKVIAVDDRWSGLKFVIRKELRAGL